MGGSTVVLCRVILHTMTVVAVACFEGCQV